MEKHNLETVISKNLDLLPEVYSKSIISEGSTVMLKLLSNLNDVILNIRMPFSGNNGNDIRVGLFYREIENIIQPILFQSGINGGFDEKINTTTSFYSLDRKQFLDTKIDSLHISSEEEVKQLIKNISNYIHNIGEPFYQKWSDFNQLNKFLDELPQQEVGSVLGQGGSFKKAIVFKLRSNEKFDDYFNMLYEFYTKRYIENPEGDVSYKQWNDVAIAMKEALDKLPTNNLS